MRGFIKGVGIGAGVSWLFFSGIIFPIICICEGRVVAAVLNVCLWVGYPIIVMLIFIRHTICGVGQKSWDTGLLVLYCILAFLLPPWGWFFGGTNMSKRNSEERRNQALKLILIATIGFIINAALVFASLMFLGILGAAVQG